MTVLKISGQTPSIVIAMTVLKFQVKNSQYRHCERSAAIQNYKCKSLVVSSKKTKAKAMAILSQKK